jgi:hypothetical protein
MPLLTTGAGAYAAAGGGGGFSLAYQSSNLSTATTTTIDYGTLTYGAGNTRVVVVIAWRAAGGSVSGVTIGGTALTQVTSVFSSAGAPDFSDIWVSSGPLAGSSGDVQVTFSTAPAGPSNAVAIYNLVTSTPAVSSANHGGAVNGLSAGAALTIPASGVAVVGSAFENASYSSASNFTVDVNLGSGRYVFGHTTSTGSVTPTVNSSGNDNIAFSAAAWGP